MQFGLLVDDGRTLEEKVSVQRHESELRAFFLQKQHWQNAIDNVRQKLRHSVVIPENLVTNFQAPICTGLWCNSRFGWKTAALKLIAQERHKPVSYSTISVINV